MELSASCSYMRVRSRPDAERGDRQSGDRQLVVGGLGTTLVAKKPALSGRAPKQFNSIGLCFGVVLSPHFPKLA